MASKRKTSPKRRGSKPLEYRQVLAQPSAFKRLQQTGEKFDVVVPVYDLKNNKLTPTGSWINVKK